MPIYEYRCDNCGHEFETIQKVSDAPLSTCPACDKDALRKKVSAAGFRLKGGGWYETDFKADKKRNVAGEEKSSDGGGKEGGKESSKEGGKEGSKEGGKEGRKEGGGKAGGIESAARSGDGGSSGKSSESAASRSAAERARPKSGGKSGAGTKPSE